MHIELLTRTLILLTTQTVAASISAYLFRKLFNLPMLIISFVISIILIFVIIGKYGESDDAVMIFFLTTLFGFAEGATLGGFVIAMGEKYNVDSDTLRQGVAMTFGICAAIMVVAAAIGLFTGLNFQGLNGLFTVILLIFIVGSFIGVGAWLGKVWQTISGIGMAVFFSIWMIVDFNMVVEKFDDARWGHAAQIAMKIFLDLVNIFIRLLPIILKLMSKGKD